MFSVSLCFYYAPLPQADMRIRDKKTLDTPRPHGVILLILKEDVTQDKIYIQKSNK